MPAILNKTKVELSQKFKITEVRRNWAIFSWFEKVSIEKSGNDIFITTQNEIDSVYLNNTKIK